MASTLPTPASFTTKVDGVDRYLAAHMNAVQDEIAAIERGQHSSQTVTEAVLVSGIDFALGETAYVTLTANRVMGAPLNPIASQRGKVVFIEGGAGNFTVTLPSAVSAPNWTLNLAVGAITELPLEYYGTTSKWLFASNPPDGIILDRGGREYNLKSSLFGAKGDGAFVTDASITSGQQTITSPSNPWKAADVGKLLFAQYSGASSATQVGTISGFNGAGSITASFTAGSTLAGTMFVGWATDDTTAILNWIATVQANHARGVIPWGYYGLNGPPVISDACQLEGAGLLELWGTIAYGGQDSACFPRVAPYFTGSVFWQFAPNTDGMDITAVGRTVNLRDFGIMFAQLYANSGHGINAIAPNYLGKPDTGLVGASWESVKVYGHDGNHYGIRLVNFFNSKFSGLKAYGGGGVDLRADTAITFYGNSVFEECMAVTFLAGSSDCLRLEATGNLALNMLSFNRVQAWLRNPGVAIPGTTPPTASQKRINTDTNVGAVSWLSPDFEDNAGGGAPTYGSQGIDLIGGIGPAGRYLIGGRTAGDVVLGLQGRAAGAQTGDLLQIFKQTGQTGKEFFINAKGQLCLGSNQVPASSGLNANITSVTFAASSIDQVGQLIVLVAAGGLAANTKICTITFHDVFPNAFFLPRIRLSNETDGVGLAVVNFYVGAQSGGTSFDLYCNQALVQGTYKVGYIVWGGQ